MGYMKDREAGSTNLNVLDEKTILNNDDLLLINDSEALYTAKRTTYGDLKASFGSGIQNYVQNPDAESSRTQYTSHGGDVADVGTAPSPLLGNESFRVTGVTTAGAGTWWQWDLDDIDAYFIGKPLFFSVKTSASAASAFKVCIYNFTDLAELAETCVTIPGGMYEAKGFFIPVTGKTYKVRITQIANGTATCDVDDVFVGDEPVRYGAGRSIVKSALFSTGTAQSSYANGGGAEINCFQTALYNDSASITRTGNSTITLAAGKKYKLTSNMYVVTFSAATAYAVHQFYNNTAAGYIGTRGVPVPATTTAAEAPQIQATAIIEPTVLTTISLRSPAGSGTSTIDFTYSSVVIEEMEVTPSNIQLADRALEEFASNSSQADADDTTSFVYGSSGSFIQRGALTAARKRRIRFQTPVLPTDSLVLEVKNVRGYWVPLVSSTVVTAADNAVISYQAHNNTTYGVGIYEAVNATDIDVRFGRYRALGATYDGAGGEWSTFSGLDIYWRVRKVSGGAQVGFPVSSANIVGRTDGLAPAAGMVGENIFYLHAASQTVSSSAYTNLLLAAGVSSFTLGKGVWDIKCGVLEGTGTANTALRFGISTDSTTEFSDLVLTVNSLDIVGTPGWVNVSAQFSCVKILTASTTFYVKANTTTSAARTYVTSINATRIA